MTEGMAGTTGFSPKNQPWQIRSDTHPAWETPGGGWRRQEPLLPTAGGICWSLGAPDCAQVPLAPLPLVHTFHKSSPWTLLLTPFPCWGKEHPHSPTGFPSLAFTHPRSLSALRREGTTSGFPHLPVCLLSPLPATSAACRISSGRSS